MLSIGIIGAPIAAALGAAAVLQLFACSAAVHAVEPVAPANFGALEGTVGGRPLVARAALLSASGNGEAFLAIAHAGPYSVVHFLDFRAAWFQAPGATPRKGEGTRPPDGSYAAILSNAGGKAAGKGVNWPIGVAGTVTLDAFPKSTAERATGSLDVRFDSGERLQGTFSAQACSKLFLGSAPPGRSP